MKKILFLLACGFVFTSACAQSDTTYRTLAVSADKQTVTITETTIWHQDIDKFYENLKADSIAEQMQKKKVQNQNTEHDKAIAKLHQELIILRAKKK